MTIRPIFRSTGVPLFKAVNIPAVDEDTTCNCCGSICNCTVPNDTPERCIECADTAYQTSGWSTPRNWKISIAGVTNGEHTNCTAYQGPGGGTQLYFSLGGTCERAAYATDTGFFNADFVVGPCTGTRYEQCLYHCTEPARPEIPWGPLQLCEYNVLNISVGASTTLGNWEAQVTLHSTFWGEQVTQAEACPTILANNGGAWYLYSTRVKTFNFSRATPTVVQRSWYEALCPYPRCENPERNIIQCVPSGWTITPSTTSSSNSTCLKALNFSGASCTVEAV